MDNQLLLRESVENLFYFEYYKFKHSFGFAYLIIGILNIIINLLDFYSFSQNNSIVYFGFPTFLWFGVLSVIIYFAITLFLVFIVRSINKTQIINGILVKSLKRTLLGISIIIIGLYFSNAIVILFFIYIFSFINPQILNYNYDLIIEVFVETFILFGIYYAETILFFRNEHNNSFNIFSLFLILFYFISSIFWFIFLFLPNPYPNGFSMTYLNYFYTFLYFEIFIYNILIALFGFYEMMSLPDTRRDFLE